MITYGKKEHSHLLLSIALCLTAKTAETLRFDAKIGGDLVIWNTLLYLRIAGDKLFITLKCRLTQRGRQPIIE